MYDFSRKIFLMLYSIKRPNFIAWLPLPREILGNMFIAVVSFPGCDITNFEVNFIFLIKLFFLHDQKLKRKIWVSWERTFNCQNLSQTWECVLQKSLLRFLIILIKKHFQKNFSTEWNFQVYIFFHDIFELY